MWLRDNCPTAHDKDSHHRMFNILNVSENLSVKDFKIDNKGSLEVQWSEGDHTSCYDLNWLRQNCYTLKNKSKYISPYNLWDQSLGNKFESICIEHDEILESNEV
jgi:gamma-butyrobetaine dioxygenase